MLRRVVPADARALCALLAGLLFGLGLGIAEMVDPLKVLAFLDVAGAWDPSLLVVLGVAMPTAAIGYRLVQQRPAPLFDERFHLPAARGVDGRLLLGAALFGIGWGLAGYCPGPAFASLGFGNAEAPWVVPAMLAGSGLARWLARRARVAGRSGADAALP